MVEYLAGFTEGVLPPLSFGGDGTVSVLHVPRFYVSRSFLTRHLLPAENRVLRVFFESKTVFA